MNSYIAKLTYKKNWIGKSESTTHTKNIKLNADSFAEAERMAIRKTEYPSGHFDVKVVSIEAMDK